jgi:hypothetical protein
MTLSAEKQKIIQETFDRLQSIEATIKELKLNYRTVAKYLNNKPDKRKCNPIEAIRIYQITGSLKRTASILGISKVTVWRNLKSQNVNVGKGATNWKRLYLTLRKRVSKSTWRQAILEKYNYMCVLCSAPSRTVHHLKKLSDLRDEVVKNYPQINPFNSFEELRQFTNLVMELHKMEDGIVLCTECHNKEHSKI